MAATHGPGGEHEAQDECEGATHDQKNAALHCGADVREVTVQSVTVGQLQGQGLTAREVPPQSGYMPVRANSSNSFRYGDCAVPIESSQRRNPVRSNFMRCSAWM